MLIDLIDAAQADNYEIHHIYITTLAPRGGFLRIPCDDKGTVQLVDDTDGWPQFAVYMHPDDWTNVAATMMGPDTRISIWGIPVIREC